MKTRRNSKQSLSPLAREILAYLQRNPNACDSLLGIARWWLLKQRIETVTLDVKAAIDELVGMGLLARIPLSRGQPLYRLSERKASAAACSD